MKGPIAAVLLLLCLSCINIDAATSPSSQVKASLKQYGDSYEAEGYKQQLYDDEELYAEDKRLDDKSCPEPQPADDVKQVRVADARFVWSAMAQKGSNGNRASALLQSADGWYDAVKAAFGFERKQMREYKATAAVNNPKTLFPSKLKELDGFKGTYDPAKFPTYEGLAVGPHPFDPDLVFLLHVVNNKAEMFLTEKDGTPSSLLQQTKIDLGDLAALAGYGPSFETSAVTAYYDPKKKRYVMVWSTVNKGDDARTPPVFVAVSQSRNPLDKWILWALDLRPTLAAGMKFCIPDRPYNDYTFDFPQVSFSNDGFFIGGSSSCTSNLDPSTRVSVAGLYVIHKDALYSAPPEKGAAAEIKAAVYLSHKSWYRSVNEHELDLVPDAFEPFNSNPAPARPQGVEDMDSSPMFAMKVDNAHLSVATLTDEPLHQMVSIDTAPKIMAVVVGKGADYSSAAGYSDGKAQMPQPNTTTTLQLSYLGMPQPFGGVVFWATLHKNQLYVATGEFWGYDYVRMPSIYWAIIRSCDNICDVARKDHGLVASQDGLALAYPVIAAREDGGALLAFSYSGKGEIGNAPYPAYPGVATAMVGHAAGKGDDKTVIHIIKKGDGSLDPFTSGEQSIPWGIGSAAQVCGDQMWFAVPTPINNVPNVVSADFWYGSWITWQQL